ncbi:MAG: FAD-binding protein, partial [Bacteroidetes bacterium]|nr:FAD-binding protein [Bacteroidota bacterium]
MAPDFSILRNRLRGDLFTDSKQRMMYATDGSAYREVPVAVARPANASDIGEILRFARENGTSVIPRGAGTSLAGQVVGPGIVVDVSKYMNRIIEVNADEKWVIAEPGVVLAELNLHLAQYGLFFAPETSTANRCCIGGMLGNNSCGLHSIIYGSVRDHIISIDALLADGTEVTFGPVTTIEYTAKCNGNEASRETQIYRNLRDTLSDPANRETITAVYPDSRLKRRNNGYAIDILMDTDPFTGNGEKLNLCRLLAGSEGTLAFTLRMKLNLLPVPAKKTGLVCAHFGSMQEALKANIVALRYNPASIELIDDYILNCTRDNITLSKNRFFIKGEPAVILLIEFLEDDDATVAAKATGMEGEMLKAGYGYHFPLYTGAEEMKNVWDLRKAGLGVLLNIPGERRSVQVIEDTSVHPDSYPEYFSEFEEILSRHGLKCAYYGHIATGELHFSPLLNLRDPDDVKTYYSVARDVAMLVKKYRGSLSGEHGDGRLRGEFIPLMFGDHTYSLLKKLKQAWDPENILNPGKITDTPSIIENLRYIAGSTPPVPETTFSFPEKTGMLHAIEKCSGSGDCRKGVLMGGTMCPTFMVSGDEDKSTRGRANILREFLTRSQKANRFNHREIFEAMDLCISCKACKSECPSNVDMAKFKAEFLHHYYRSHPVPLRTLLIGWLPRLNGPGMLLRPVTNFITGTTVFKTVVGFARSRSIPKLSPVTLKKWALRHRKSSPAAAGVKGKVFLFADEFTNYNESDIGIKAIILLERLGYEVIIPASAESGRTFLSKGLLGAARKVARKNIRVLSGLIKEETPLVGIEPSAILSFRDEYPELSGDDLKEKAVNLGKNSILFEEFICREVDAGRINSASFTVNELTVRLHGHCQQKAIASTRETLRMLSLPVNYRASEIPSGCCGMAGAFGYEKEHYEMSMQIGELVPFPEVR